MDRQNKKSDFWNQFKNSEFILCYKKHFVEILVVIILFASWFMLSEFWIDTINLVIVKPFVSKLHVGLGFFTSVFIALISIYYIFVCIKERIASNGRLIFTIAISGIYLLCFFSDNWIYKTPIENWKWLSYANVLLLPFIGEMIHLIWLALKPKIEGHESELEFEQALQEDSIKDSYNRNPYITAISTNLINAFDKNGSFAIGISGSWGTGKSSFINILKGKLRSSVDIIIEFKPWYCKTPNDIIEEFFKKYQSEISVYAPNISSLIKEYSHALAEVEESKIASWINYSISRFDVKDIQSQYDEIKEKLIKLNLNVVVIIDDLDRLDTGEVMEVLRLIRNSANFPFTQFIVAYDKEYVVQSISNNDIPNATQFLEKIFNLEITLPKFEERIICQELLTRMENFLVQIGISKGDPQIKEMIYLSYKTGNEDFDMIVPKILKTNRDIIRFYNSFKLNLKPFIDNNIYSEIDHTHFYYLELIRYGFPEIYSLLRDDPLLILDVNFVTRRFIYKSKSEKVGLDGTPLPKEEDEFLNTYLHSDHLKNKRVTYYLLREMFQNNSGKAYSNQIWHLRSYGKYFSYRLDSDIISIDEILLLLDNVNPLKEVEILYLSKKAGEIEDKLSVCFSYLTPANISYVVESNIVIKNEPKLPFEKVYSFVRILLKSENQGLIKEVLRASQIHLHHYSIYSEDQLKSLIELWMYIMNLYDKISNNDNFEILTSLLYRGNLSRKLERPMRSSDIEMIKELLVNTICPVTISQLISDVIEVCLKEKMGDESLTLSIQSLKEIQLNYLKFYTTEKTELDEEGITLLYQCQKSTNPKTHKVSLYNEALQIMRGFIEVHPSGYISNFIRTGWSSSKIINKVFPEPFYEDLFKTNDSFEKFIMRDELSSVFGIEKVRNYWQIYKCNDFRPIEFNNQGVVEEIINSNFVSEIVKLNKLKEISKQVNSIVNKLKKLKADSSSIDEIRLKMKELETQRAEIDLYISLNGQIHDRIESLLTSAQLKVSK